jgi:hypothetical protein
MFVESLPAQSVGLNTFVHIKPKFKNIYCSFFWPHIELYS